MRLIPLAAATAAAAVLLAPAPAQAHPFGPPQTVAVSAQDGRVLVRWGFGATDDISYLAAALGVLPEERILLDGAILYEDADAPLLADAPEFADYLREHIEVAAGGQDCIGDVQPPDDLAADGVVVAFDCPTSSATASVTVDMMLDTHPAYTTMATGPDDQRAVYDAEDTSHDWVLGEGAVTADGADATTTTGAGRSAALQLGGVLGVLAVVAAGATALVRRRSRP